MKRRALQLLFGFALGAGARFLLPGHHAANHSWSMILALGGAVAGEGLGAWVLPADVISKGGFVLAAMGALSALLAQALIAG